MPRFLRQVVTRTIRPTFHVTELLECGHRQDVFTAADPLTAKYRTCDHCAKITLPEKKPVAIARIPAWRKVA